MPSSRLAVRFFSRPAGEYKGQILGKPRCNEILTPSAGGAARQTRIVTASAKAAAFGGVGPQAGGRGQVASGHSLPAHS
jgi:hypothetical protein